MAYEDNSYMWGWTVYESSNEDIDIGLTDQYGNTIYRVIHKYPIGFQVKTKDLKNHD